jgi:hypothetical protein
LTASASFFFTPLPELCRLASLYCASTLPAAALDFVSRNTFTRASSDSLPKADEAAVSIAKAATTKGERFMGDSSIWYLEAWSSWYSDRIGMDRLAIACSAFTATMSLGSRQR